MSIIEKDPSKSKEEIAKKVGCTVKKVDDVRREARRLSNIGGDIFDEIVNKVNANMDRSEARLKILDEQLTKQKEIFYKGDIIMVDLSPLDIASILATAQKIDDSIITNMNIILGQIKLILHAKEDL